MSKFRFNSPQKNFKHAQSAPSRDQIENLLSLYNKREYQETIGNANQFIKVYPKHYFGWKILGASHERLSQYNEAKIAMQKAASIDPKDVENLANLAKVLKELGLMDEAILVYKKITSTNPDYTAHLARYIFLLNYMSQTTPGQLFMETKNYGAMLSQKANANRFKTWHKRDPQKPMHIGLVSGDLFIHPVGFFLENLLSSLKSHGIRITAYPTQEHLQDGLTQRLRNLCAHWKPVSHLNDLSAAQLVHQDEIDILFDLSGYSAHHRLGIFAHKPAPVQITWLGYFATTGLPEMDYILADETSIGTDESIYFTEKVIRIKDTRLCYGWRQLQYTPMVSKLPALESKNNQLTLGCYQNMSKITPAVLEAWSRILVALPHAKLRLQNKQFSNPEVQHDFIQRCENVGIKKEHLEMHGLSNFDDYMASYQKIDMALDTFPFPGGTTTCEALWMGVPTLTLRGDRMIAKQGASLMCAADLPDWVADNTEQYVHKAIAFGQNLTHLSQLRQGLRDQVNRTALFNADLFAKQWIEAIESVGVQMAK